MPERRLRSHSDNEALREKARSMDAKGRAVIATDPKGIVVYWNSMATEIFGWTAEDALGENIVDLTPGVEHRPEASHILRKLRSGEGWSGRFELRHRSGKTFTAHVADTPVYNRNGKLIGIVGVTTRDRGRPGRVRKKAAD